MPGPDVSLSALPVNSYLWSCEGCGYRGIVNLLAEAPASVVYQRAVMAHDDLSPGCPERKIEVDDD